MDDESHPLMLYTYRWYKLMLQQRKERLIMQRKNTRLDFSSQDIYADDQT